MSHAAIFAQAVNKTYGRGALAVPVLRDVDLTVDAGEVVMLVGPSGSGKTTLLSLLGCVLPATSGTIRLFGEQVTGLRESALPRLRLSYVGFVFQGDNLLPALSATDNITVPLLLRGFGGRAARREAHRLLDRVGLAARREHHPRELSGGERQRVAVARAVAGSPPLILADEPTAALDAHNGLVVTAMLAELAREGGHTVVVVTHDNRIFHLADRILHLEDGRIGSAS